MCIFAILINNCNNEKTYLSINCRYSDLRRKCVYSMFG